jgi:hypothetical protein
MNSKRKEDIKEFTVVSNEDIAPAASAPVAAQSPVIPISFDRWWLQTQSKYKFKPELKTAVRKHFEARGFMDYTKFNDGLRDFGFRT